jgi:hypothetical protein
MINMNFIPLQIHSIPIDMLSVDFLEEANHQVDNMTNMPFIQEEGEIIEIEDHMCIVIGFLDNSAN